ncbi:Thiamine-binding protein [Laceyella tengchongensis]|uniref:Thiamine-binding protein n=1 Tax=Laceyella tengchongensis TaxID=574699 RepID=A0AA46AG52_9BACL|nr:Thiamine-binding protein [Laceyella tengchongensis]
MPFYLRGVNENGTSASERADSAAYPKWGERHPLCRQSDRNHSASRVPYRVGPLETTMEGELPELLAIIERMNEAMIEMGCPSVLHQVKIYFNPAGASIRGLTGKYDEKQ